MRYVFLLIFALSACETAPPVARIAETPSGYPEAVFSGISSKNLANKFAARCVKKGNLLVSQSENLVVCELPMNEAEISWAKAFVGNQIFKRH